MEIDNINKIKKCRVCGDQNYVFYNYDGLSCKSCKKFFYRCAIKNKYFVCLGNDNCVVDMTTRRECQKCRLRKCLEIGMKKKLVTLYKNNSELSKTTKSNRTKREFNPYEVSLFSEIKDAFAQIDIQQNAQVVGRITTLLESVNCAEYFARTFVKFCKKIPQFKILKAADQLILLKESFSEASTICTAFYFDFKRDRISVIGDENGDQIYYIDCSLISSGMNHNHIGSSYVKFIKALKIKMNSDSTIKNLIIIYLLFKSRANVSCPEYIHYNHLMYKHLLKRYLEHKYGYTAKANTTGESILELLSKIDRSTEAINKMIKHEITDTKQVNAVLMEMLNLN